MNNIRTVTKLSIRQYRTLKKVVLNCKLIVNISQALA